MASEMACVHNVFIRSINAIYLQAPNVLRKDAHSFCRYAYVWYRLIHLHHTGEEEGFFPAVEELVGEPVMRVNVSQHEAFHKGLEIFGAYLSDCIDEPIMFNGYHLATLIDNFAPTLVSHLEDEIVTLSQLRRFGEEKLPGIAEIMTKRRKGQSGKSSSFFFVCHGLVLTFHRPKPASSQACPLSLPISTMLLRTAVGPGRRFQLGWFCSTATFSVLSIQPGGSLLLVIVTDRCSLSMLYLRPLLPEEDSAVSCEKELSIRYIIRSLRICLGVFK